MIGLKNSYEIAYNGTENECRFELYADAAAEMVGVTHYDGIKIQMGSEFTDISTGNRYLLNGSGVWVLQPSANAWENVYTKAELDSMITEIYDIIAYYHTTLVSDTGEITFYAIAGYIGTWTIYGNGSQTGTPTPDAPIMPEFVGVRTGNLFDKTKATLNTVVTSANGERPYNGFAASDYIPVSEGAYYLTNVVGIKRQIAISLFDASKTFTGTKSIAGNVVTSGTVTFESDTKYIRVNMSMADNNMDMVMVSRGSTAPDYEPYGYKIPITCGGQTNNIYLSAPLRKAIDGTDAVDTIDSSGTLTRNVDENGYALVTPTTETITVPAIPTVQGENTLTVDTTLKPSRIEISGER